MEPKPFQQRSANWIVKQLFQQTEENGQRRVLLADEVGLGKTIVARTVINDLVKIHSKQGELTTVLYLCSNADLARQNADKLKGTPFKHRLSELPIYRPQHEPSKPVIISASIGTNIALENKTGTKKERAFLYLICCKAFQIQDESADFRSFMGGRVKKFDEEIDKIRSMFNQQSNRRIIDSFAIGLLEHHGCNRTMILNAAKEYVLNGGRLKSRNRIIGWMLQELVKAGLLHGPNISLIIMDEFQRFEDVLDDVDDSKSVSYQLLNKSKIPVLLLSATPFKMYTSTWDEDANHDKLMIRLLDFLYGGEAGGLQKVGEVKKLLHKYRHQLLEAAANRGDHDERINTKEQIESIIGHVMIRTERRAFSGSLMEPKESPVVSNGMDIKDIQHYFMLRRAKIEGFAATVMSFWKSSPYLLSFCDTQYQFKRKFLQEGTHIHKELSRPHLTPLRKHMMLSSEVRNPKTKLTVTHPKLSALMKRCFEEQKSIHWLWLPPSKPYWKPAGTFVATNNEPPSKLLVFSNWRFVPRAIASLLSLEADRELHRKWGERKNDIRAMKITPEEGGTHFIVLYPSFFLAKTINPLEIVTKLAKRGIEFPRWSEIKNEAIRILKRELKAIGVTISKKGSMPSHQIYKWLIRLDASLNKSRTRNAIYGMTSHSSSAEENRSMSAWRDRIIDELSMNEPLVISEKGVELLAHIALASPATTLLRSLRNHLSNIGAETLHYQVVNFCMYTLRGFLTKTHVYSIIKQNDKKSKYWSDVLEYGIQGNIQAMWDEYIAMLASEEPLIERIIATLQKVMGLSDRSLTADYFMAGGKTESLRLPIGYCLPFSDDQKEDKADGKERVRHAFNSPFWPHVLATTSVGQEGLDFHRYCRELVHWNLPVNPIDFEQREGRINRYRSLAIRQAVGEEISWSDALRNSIERKRPWELLFTTAADRQPANSKDNDLWPDWVFYGDIEKGESRLVRHVWLFPFSKEHTRYHRMRELVVLYRLAFGQPNQEDFLKALQSRISNSGMDEAELARRYMIDLTPK